MFKSLAHSEQIYKSTIETKIHDLEWFVQIPLFIVFIAVCASIIWLVTKKIEVTILLTGLLLLVIGVGFYSLVPIVSAVAITSGLLVALFITLASLGGISK